MYNGNENIRSANETHEYTEEQILELIECAGDDIYFAENYFNIITLAEGKQVIELWPFQKDLLRVLDGRDVKDDKYSIIILSSRQSSKTTTISIYALWYVLFHKDKTVYILANKQDSAIEILDRIKVAYEMLPLWMQVGVMDYNAKSITFANGSKIRVAATSPSAIRGKSANVVICDEYAFIPTNIAEEFDKSVFPTISSVSDKSKRNDAKIILISTPNGLNHFYAKWKKAIMGQGDFTPFEVKWTDVPGRDETFKQDVIDNFGERYWAQEYACVGGDSLVTVKNQYNEQYTLPIDELYKWYEGMKQSNKKSIRIRLKINKVIKTLLSFFNK